MPKLWAQTIETHRREVREAILDTTAALVFAHGLRAVTMSQIAEEVGIGRATLYKYFPDIEAILVAWHERLVAEHLARLAEIRDRGGNPRERLRAVLESYAMTAARRSGSPEVGAVVHQGEHFTRAQDQLRTFVRDLLAEGAQAGLIRTDVSPDELASYCLHALAAASQLPSAAAVRRLVTVTMTGLHSGPPGRQE